MVSTIRKTLLAAFAAAVLASPAAAQGITIGPDGVRIIDPRNNDDRDRRGPPPRVDRRDDRRDDRRGPPERRGADLTEREAVRIARTEGLRDVEEVNRTRSTWKVVGTDRRGDDIVVTVDRRSGRVLDVN